METKSEKPKDTLVNLPLKPTNEATTNEAPLPYAGFILRFFAFLVDSVILGFIPFLLVIPEVMPAIDLETVSTKQLIAMLVESSLLTYLAFFVIHWLYFAIMESSKLQATLGKLMLGLKVSNIHGQRVTFLKSTARYVWRLLSVLTLFLGFVLAGFTSKKQTLHDLLAGCLVLKK